MIKITLVIYWIKCFTKYHNAFNFSSIFLYFFFHKKKRSYTTCCATWCTRRRNATSTRIKSLNLLSVSTISVYRTRCVMKPRIKCAFKAFRNAVVPSHSTSGIDNALLKVKWMNFHADYKYYDCFKLCTVRNGFYFFSF